MVKNLEDETDIPTRLSDEPPKKPNPMARLAGLWTYSLLVEETLIIIWQRGRQGRAGLQDCGAIPSAALCTRGSGGPIEWTATPAAF